MPINLDTGIVQVPRHTNQANVGYGVHGRITEYNDTTPSEFVFFPTDTRQVLLVEPKQMVIVTGYNLTDDTKVTFRKVLRSNGIPAQGTADCCPSVTVAHTIRLHSVTLPCWRLDRCNPVFVIKTPAAYEIDVEGNTVDVVLTAVTHELQDINSFAFAQSTVGGCACKE